MNATVNGLQPGLIYQPVIFKATDTQQFDELLQITPGIQVYDELQSQLEELVKSRSPRIRFTSQSLSEAIRLHLGGIPMNLYGVWAFYPWSNRLVHLLDEAEFTEVRTNRNIYKITPEERDALKTKKVGLIGLSVGQSVSVTMAMERSFGELRIADYDLLELTNLNRIRTGVHNLGLKKTVSVAREIMEIDPYLNLKLFHEGITEENIDAFITEGGKLDVLIDECDGIDIKVLCRIKARQYRVPVLMEASDRGMVDVERFDLEPDRPILHGMIDHLDISKLKTLKTNEEKVPYMLPIVGIDTISDRSKASMMEIGETITTWPQLASAVTYGGGITADVCRRMLLGHYKGSGRFYVDVEEIINDPQPKRQPVTRTETAAAAPPLSVNELKHLISNHEQRVVLSHEQVQKLIGQAVLAPSGGNLQPWIWLYTEGTLFLFQDMARKSSLLDIHHTATDIALGAALENLVLASHAAGHEIALRLFPDGGQSALIAAIDFYNGIPEGIAIEPHTSGNLASSIPLRHTNRNIRPRIPIAEDKLQLLAGYARTVPGAMLHIASDEEALHSLGEIIACVERLRIMNPEGHRNFIEEMRWTVDENLRTRDGVDIATCDLTPSEQAGFWMSRNPEVINLLRQWKGGSAFEKLSRKSTNTASALGLITMPAYSREDFISGGRAMQRTWLASNYLGIAFQPQSPATFLFHRLIHAQGNGLDISMQHELPKLRSQFLVDWKLKGDRTEIFMFRLFVSEEPEVKSLRRPLDEVLFFV